MKPKVFMENAVVALAVLTAFNYLVHLYYKPERLAVVHRMEKQSRIELLVFGDSAIGQGCLTKPFQQAWSEATGDSLAVFNLGLDATGPVEHCVLLAHALARHPEVKYAVYGFWDFRLTEPILNRGTNLVENMAVGYYLNAPVAARFYSESSRLEEWRFRLVSQVPMLTERYALWRNVERLRRTLDDIGLRPPPSAALGYTPDVAAMRAASAAQFTEIARGFVDQGVPLWAPVREILSMCRARGVKVAVVQMPRPGDFRTTYYSSDAWSRYRAHVRALLEGEGVVFVDAHDWVENDRDFRDTVHFASPSADNFSRRLARTLARQFDAAPERRPSRQ